MQRIDKIYQTLTRLCEEKFDGVELTDLTQGTSANEISQELGLARNSVSEDLNKLASKGQAVKIKSRPVWFFSKEWLETAYQINLPLNNIEYKSLPKFLETFQEQTEPLVKASQATAFQSIIGVNGSLKESVDKLKAAVLYPPNGLNMLIRGESGVGKTMLAEALHQYLVQYQKQELPFVYFNCAEYFNNPELLTSHLFGYSKGSFTGADQDKPGLVEKANGGFLFLDEVHRLTSEGQEKLFTILDKGYFSRMGETDQRRTVSIRFIFATTENTTTTFLKTFLRRIPVIVSIPSLAERPIKERVELLIQFFQAESYRIKKDVHVPYEVIEELIFQGYTGNIGQLKADIQFICAQAYLQQLSENSEHLVIDKRLIANVPRIQKNAEEQIILKEIITNDGLTIYADQKLENISAYLVSNDKVDDAFYSFLLREFSKLKNSNIPENEVTAIMQKKLEQLFDMKLFSEETDATIIHYDRDIDSRLEKLTAYISELLGIPIPAQLRNALARHVYSLLFFIDATTDDEFYHYTSQLLLGKLEYYNEAVQIVDKMSELLGIETPRTEITYISLLLRKLKQETNNYVKSEDCGIIVVAHGATTASSMVEYSNILFATNLMQAVDMPIQQSVENTLDKIREIIRVNQYKKLILMVDIGSLVYFGNLISEEFDIEVLLIKNINLLSLLEVSREVLYESTDFSYLLPVLNEKNHESTLCTQGKYHDRKVLIVSCMTGLGTALKIERLIIDTFQDQALQNVRILTLDNQEVQNLDTIYKYTYQDERIVGVIGTFPTELPDIPFISLEELFSEKGVERLLVLFGYDMAKPEHRKLKKEISGRYIQGLSLKAIVNYITVLNPQRLSIEMKEVFSDITMQLKIQPSEKIMLRFLIHCCCTVERLVLNNDQVMTDHDVSYQDLPNEASVIKMAFRPIEVSYGIQLSPLEIKYIYELLYA